MEKKDNVSEYYKSFTPKKEKKVGNISEYENFTPLIKMEKPRSPFSVWFMLEDPKDDWLINIVRFKTKTGELAYECMVIKPDLERQIELYEKDGFVQLTQA
jgi:hypothetical protein